MKKKIQSFINVKVICGALIGICLFNTACKKKEFMPEPEGQQVPYVDSVQTSMQALLKTSPYKLFYAAWQRSHMEQFIIEKGEKRLMTLFVPDDAAMRAAGLDEAGINARTPEQLDSLVMYHLLRDKMEVLGLQSQLISVSHTTFLVHPQLKQYLILPGNAGGNIVAYEYRHYTMVGKDGGLVINGNPCGNYKPTVVLNGILWPVNRVLLPPTKHIIDYINEDPRFSYLKEINEINKVIWDGIVFGSFPRLADLDLGPAGDVVTFNAFLAPTNEAFHKAGFKDLADLEAVSNRFTPEPDWDNYKIDALIPTDSILAYHNWGRMYAQYGNYGRGPAKPSVFFTADMRNEAIGNYQLHTSGWKIDEYLMPLYFINEGNTVSIQVKGSKAPPVKIIEANINTFEGPLHIVDGLLIPDGFKVHY
ncbi:fasciclin domain-containing protein [Chitinophaga nivalis]|uniref:Fasciclin domain-containing protein n=1 Tax=Chitinophaga nivalis TaxID=2991709 RepID=A0ABT3IGQ4_9BACT|nr:fasciclin domain-containing protein [Chitinophaga nivalis]MCW3467212.1 fasciclin domain-containing protein [Chitinophaga nivalis]MCW3483096.1 fasciclin domain-containing protein [Chitinophaga nivalis]